MIIEHTQEGLGMSPKFRGDSQDWLDDESDKKGQGKSGPRKRRKGRASEGRGACPWEQANAVVTEVFPNQCRVLLFAQTGQNKGHLLCSYRRATVFTSKDVQTNTGRERTPVAVGDLVLVSQSDSANGVIEGICDRKNSLSRPAPGREAGKFFHVLAANLDLLVIVVSVQDPPFSSGLVDRFLVAAEVEKIPIMLCVTKMDLHVPTPSGEFEKPWELYRHLGYSVHEVSAKAGIGISGLLEFFLKKKVAFCGHSGVGKTSLLNELLGRTVGKVGAINEATRKGRHTTSGAVLLEGPDDSFWIDTPGVRELGLVGVLPEGLAAHFPEFRNLGCAESKCLHLDEDGCSAQHLPRYQSYRRILLSLLEKETEV